MNQVNAKEFAWQQIKELWSKGFQQRERSSEVRFWNTMHKNNASTIDNVYQVVKSRKEKNKSTILRADRNVLQHIIIAYDAGCKVDLHRQR